MSDSVIVDEVRRRRKELSLRFNDDLRAYREHLREIEIAEAARMVEQITVVRADKAAHDADRKRE